MMTGDCDWQASKKHKTLPSMTMPMPQEVNKVKTCFFAQWIQREHLQKTMQRLGAQYIFSRTCSHPFLGIQIIQ